MKKPAIFLYNSAGFTLIELLINLSILSMLFILIIPFAMDGLNRIEDQQFLNQFSHDILYVQSLAINKPNHKPRIRISRDKYAIYSTLSKPAEALRKIPNKGFMHSDRLQSISFTKNGTIQKAGTITLSLSSGTYSMVFPPGKGREHIVKQ